MENMKLTKIDRQILESYIPVVEGLAAYLSSYYEIVLHSLEDYDHSVICIINGEHTGRKVGAPITDLALNMLDAISKGHEDHIVYFSRNKKNEPLKSTTIAIRGEKNRIIGLICINMYLNVSLNDVMTSLIKADPIALAGKSEDFSQDTGDLIHSTYESEKAVVMSDSTILPSNKNKAIIEGLYKKGIFRLKDSVIMVAGLMGMSKNTVYMHIRNYKKNSNN